MIFQNRGRPQGNINKKGNRDFLRSRLPAGQHQQKLKVMEGTDQMCSFDKLFHIIVRSSKGTLRQSTMTLIHDLTVYRSRTGRSLGGRTRARKDCFQGQESCWNHVGIMSESCQNHVGIMSGSCRNHVGIMSESRRNHVGIMSEAIERSMERFSHERSSDRAIER